MYKSPYISPIDKRKESDAYHVLIYRKDDTITKESIFEEFMYFLKYDSEDELTPEQTEDLQELINKFLAYDIEKVKRGELEMLTKWNKAVSK